MKKVLLIYPNTSNIAWISTAVPILIGISKNHGFETAYFDTYKYQKSVSSNNEKEMQGGFKPGYQMIFKEQLPYDKIVVDLQQRIDEMAPDLIVVTALSADYEFFMSFWNKIKLSSDAKVVIGGIHSIISYDEVLAAAMFDLVCVGQAETIFPEILLRIKGNLSLDGIAGTYYLDRSTKTYKKYLPAKLLTSSELWNIDGDFTVFDDDYFLRPFDGRIVRRYDIEIARGCPYNCSYCGNSALKEAFLANGDPVSSFLTLRPMDSSFSHLKKMINDRRIDIFQFTDECFLAHPVKWLNEFMNRYSEECRRPFIFQTRSETVSEEKIGLIEKHGIPFQVSIGVESGADHILNDVCNRKCRSEQVVSAFDILHRHHIRTNAFFMIGFPYETREDFFKTVDLCRRIKPSVSSVAIFQPLPGQRLTKLCVEKGFITGREPLATFTSHSILNMPAPYLSAKEIKNLWRTFILYSTLPKERYPDIQKCEVDYDNNQELFDELIKLRWQCDYAKERQEVSLLKFIDQAG